jgi:uncharacterized protein HemX
MEPNSNNTNLQDNAPQQPGMGALVGTLIVLAVLVLGGVYFYLNKQMAEPQTPPVILGDTTPTPPLEQSSPAPSSSDDVNAIEADVSATDLDQLEAQIDADLKTIESNL